MNDIAKKSSESLQVLEHFTSLMFITHQCNSEACTSSFTHDLSLVTVNPSEPSTYSSSCAAQFREPVPGCMVQPFPEAPPPR